MTKLVSQQKKFKTFAVTKEASLGGNKFCLVKDYNSPTLMVGLNKVMLFITMQNHL